LRGFIGGQGEPHLTEPLLESARILYTMAPMTCRGDHVDPQGCAWYHGIWQYLRLFDMVSSPSWHSEFYQRALAESLAGDGPRRVLISGAADYSLLAYVFAAAKIVGKLDPAQLEIHVLDQCPTPLNACRWYARRFEFPLFIHERDILGKRQALVREICGSSQVEEKGFDLITTDAFLTRFPREQVDRVFDRWRALLKPGGRIVTTVRLHPLEPRRRADDPRTGVPQDLVRFSLRLRERALGWRNLMGIDLDALVGAARTYTLKIVSTDIGDLRDVVSIARKHGFEPERGGHETGEVSGELVPGHYARLILSTT
jgi:hypothetical protein